MTYQPISINEFEAALPERTYGIQTMRDAIADVAVGAGLDVREIRGKSTKGLVSRCRHLAMWKSRKEGVSLPMIAQYFKRDTATVQYGINKIEGLQAEARRETRNANAHAAQTQGNVQ